MTSRVHCDICDEYELPVGRRKYQVGYLSAEESPTRDPVYIEFDLCFECESQILRFMLKDQLDSDTDFQGRLVKVIRERIEIGHSYFKEGGKNGVLDNNKGKGTTD